MRRWLIDVDRDTEGMQVLADLHGGDPEDMIAKAEFQEIKDRVMFEVCTLSITHGARFLTFCSVSLAKHGLTRLCGKSISVEFYWPCHLKLSHNW